MLQDAYQHAFALRNHWWIDAGIAGLYYIAEKKSRELEFQTIQRKIDANSLILQAPDQSTLKAFLYQCYQELADKHWNVSTLKQREANDLVSYSVESGEFKLIPKRNPTPIPALFTKGSSFRAPGIEYDQLTPELKEEVDKFLKEQRKQLWGKKKKLLYKAPVCHPQVEIFPQKGRKVTCSICGQESICQDVAQPSFLLFSSKTSTLSFNSQCKSPDKICWECDFLSKFAIDSAHYKSSGDRLSILQIACGNVEKLIDNHFVLGSQAAVRQLESDFFHSNIGAKKESHRLLYHANLSHELLWALFHDSYSLIKDEADTRLLSAEEDESDLQTIFQPLLEYPIQLLLLTVSSKGQTFMLKEIISYSEITYLFRLLHSCFTAFSDSSFICKVFHDLYLPVEGKRFDVNFGLWRNQILRRILQKQSIIQEVERFAYHKSVKHKFPYLGNLLKFILHYQIIILEGCGLRKEHIDVAVNLGKQIVLSAKESSNSNFDRVKGDLFALRKTRNATDFLEQLNRVQFRYNMIVSKQILGGIIGENTAQFADFKSYCLLAALNQYNSLKKGSISQDKVDQNL